MSLWYLLAAHLLICSLILLGIRSGKLRVHPYMFFVGALLPFWGILTILILHFQIVIKADGGRNIGVEKMKLESELYRPIVVDTGKNVASTVPMEEALLINTSAQRRALILDVLNDNPEDYIEFLQKAGDNDDTEVVHYAVTAMVEISKENDDTLHLLEAQYRQNPEDMELLTVYTEFLWNCLSQNMMQGQVEVINRQLFSDLMEKKLAMRAELVDYTRLVRNELAREHFSRAGELLERMIREFPKREKPYLLKLQYLAAQQRGAEIARLIDEIKKKQIYLSAKGKEAIAFWDT